jgi:predicted enzyme related to lactoylglutathione lyase
MPDAAPHVTGVSSLAIDARDPELVGRFWAQLLGGEVRIDSDGDAIVRTASGPRLDFLRVPEPKTVKNRLHLDLSVTDLEASTLEAIALGATRADDVYDGGRWQVLRDPEGNEFCLLPPGLS